MQVKHPPNQITAVYNVTSTTSATSLCYGSKTSILDAVIIDGENKGIITSYTFPMTGEHEVRFIVKKTATDFSYFFYAQKQLVRVDFTDFNCSVSSADSMFRNCWELTTIINWNPRNNGKSINVDRMLEYCPKLVSIDTSEWDFANFKNTGGLFRECESLTTIDTSKWDMSNVTSVTYMFYKCYALTFIDTSNWNLSNVVYASNMFERCTSLTAIDTSNWNLNKMSSLSYMFYRCSALTSIDMSSWDFSNVTTAYSMFENASNLQTLYFNTEFADSVTTTNMFTNAGVSSPKLYYYPHASFVENFLPKVPAKWQKIDITTLE